MYPNEVQLTWSVLIVLYPFITGLVAGAFILASLARVFQIKAVQPIYRLSLLTALAFLLVAPLPLQLHLGHPERSFEMYMTPHRTSAMAMFGFVYLWYLLVVLLLEIWLDYRKDIILAARSRTGAMKWIYSALTLGSSNIDAQIPPCGRARGLGSDPDRHPVSVPPAWIRGIHFRFRQGESVVVNAADARCFHFLGDGLRDCGRSSCLPDDVLHPEAPDRHGLPRYGGEVSALHFLIDFSLEMLDLVHRMYEASQSFRTLDFMVHTRLYVSQIVLQIVLGTLIPIAILALFQVVRLSAAVRRRIYTLAAALALVGIFAMRWNVVIGGQLFSKSFLGYTTYKMAFAAREGLLPAIALLILPLLILWGLMKLLPPWAEAEGLTTARRKLWRLHRPIRVHP